MSPLPGELDQRDESQTSLKDSARRQIEPRRTRGVDKERKTARNEEQMMRLR